MPTGEKESGQIIDAHHHLWSYSVEEYGWIDERMSVIARDFLPADLRAVAEPLGVVGTVAVQARQVPEETDALLAAAEANPGFVRGVVGWAPLADAGIDAVFDRWAGKAALKGFRHVVQDEPDNEFILGADFGRGVAKVLDRGYVYEILIFERQLEPSIRFVDQHPGGRFVLDHVAKPLIAAGELEPWKTHIAEMAKRENVVCKVSAMVTEAEWDNWTLDTLRPYLDATLDAFGPGRLMFGSDWPVALLATDYERWLRTVQQWTADWSADERQAFYSSNAIEAYGLNDSST